MLGINPRHCCRLLKRYDNLGRFACITRVVGALETFSVPHH